MTATDTSPHHNTYYSISPCKEVACFFLTPDLSRDWLLHRPMRARPSQSFDVRKKQKILPQKTAEWNALGKLMLPSEQKAFLIFVVNVGLLHYGINAANRLIF
ncbi:hypothetical protein XENORESO_019095 [Xenotaenia resolanae]|uniref:Uncharacterized protein n=1 Tax=Xenotaenia resolanae TaxID=208358 RepID=A0ABV0W5T7_9TELE